MSTTPDITQADRVICIYIGSASRSNLAVGLDQGIWGFKKPQDDYAALRPGDLVLLGSGFSGGSPRVKLDGWQQHSLAEVEVGRVTSEAFEDSSQVWPDEVDPDTSYPYRFRFERLGRVRDVSLAPDGPLGTDVADALRRSAIAQGRGYVLDAPSGFTLVLPGGHPPPAPTPHDMTTPPASIQVVVDGFLTELARAGIVPDQDLGFRFLCGLMTKPFVICTGLSGSGKTQLAMALGRWLADPERLHVAAVRPDWTGAEALFGFENMLLPAGPDGRMGWTAPAELRFMLRAADNPGHPHLLVLDEMNLAHVERYFADVLSGMESAAAVLPNLIEDDDGIWRLAPDGPERIPIPRNLLIVGTVNMDETTYQFSPKVLDRSTSLEFRVTTDALSADSPDLTRIRPASQSQQAALVGSTPAPTGWPSDEVRKGVEELHRLLATHGREFGHRTFQEMQRYAAIAAGARPAIDDDTVLDHLVMHKVLPRIHGSSRELSSLMSSLAEFVGGDQAPRLPLAADKVRRMTAELEATHFTSF